MKVDRKTLIVALLIGALLGSGTSYAIARPSDAEDLTYLLPDAADLGRCPGRGLSFGDKASQVTPWFFFLRYELEWLQVDDVRPVSGGGSEPVLARHVELELVGALPVAALVGRPPPARTRRVLVDAASRGAVIESASRVKRDLHSTLYVGVHTRVPKVSYVVASDAAHRIAFVGECGMRMSQTFQTYLRSLEFDRLTPVVADRALLDVVADMNGPPAQALRRWVMGDRTRPPPGPSASQPFAGDYDSMIRDKELRGLQLRVRLPPPTPRQEDFALMWRNSAGMVEGASLRVSEAGEVSLNARTKLDQPVELWLWASERPVAYLATIDSALVRSAVESKRAVELAPTESARTLDDLISVSRQGRDALRVTSVR